MALTSQQSTHCNYCDGNHLPAEPHTSQARPRGGGRHLAPKKPKTPARLQRQSRPRREPIDSTKSEVEVKRVPVPSGEELRTSTGAALRKVGGKGGKAVNGIVASCRQWWGEAKRGMRDLIDLESLKAGAEERRHIDKPARMSPPTSSGAPSRPVPDQGPAPTPYAAARTDGVSAAGVQVLERGASREHLLEVSVLESLGFFDPAHEIVVTMSQPQTSLGMEPDSRPVPEPHTRGRQLIPDIDLLGWKPHVIARSKLGRGRISTTMITVLAVTLLVLAVIATNLLRAPAEEAALEENSLAAASDQLAVALQGLEPVLANVTSDVAESTSTLMSIDAAAREVFDRAATLGEDPQQRVLRQSAASLAQRSLALQTVIGDALNYRLVLNPLWNSPDLAGGVDPTSAAAALASWQALLADMVESLPSSSELAVHVEQVRGFVVGLEDWRIRYLDAVSLSDLAAAEAAVADLEGQLSLLAQSGEDILSGVFADASTERGRILADLGTLSG